MSETDDFKHTTAYLSHSLTRSKLDFMLNNPDNSYRIRQSNIDDRGGGERVLRHSLSISSDRKNVKPSVSQNIGPKQRHDDST